MGWWGFTFPLGVYTVSTVTLGEEIPSAFFRVLGTVFSVTETVLWLGVSLGTIYHAYTGHILVAPCLKDIQGKEDAAREHFREQKE